MQAAEVTISLSPGEEISPGVWQVPENTQIQVLAVVKSNDWLGSWTYRFLSAVAGHPGTWPINQDWSPSSMYSFDSGAADVPDRFLHAVDVFPYAPGLWPDPPDGNVDPPGGYGRVTIQVGEGSGPNPPGGTPSAFKQILLPNGLIGWEPL